MLIFDVDNTIIDTDNHFKKAQFEMLRVLEEDGHINNHKDKLDVLRDIDMRIADEEDINEYDFKLLSRSLVYYFVEDYNITKSVEERYVESDFEDLCDNMLNSFNNQLSSNHDLVDGFKDAYSYLSSIDFSIVAFSEGERQRIEKELKYHNVFDIFDDLIVGNKSPSKFESVASERENVVVIGDSLERDIEPANKNGFYTIHHPAGFEDSDYNVKPDFVVNDMRNLPHKLKQIID